MGIYSVLGGEMTREIFLGIDGGGTKTAFILEVAGEQKTCVEKTIHLSQASREEFKKRLENGINKLTSSFGISPEDISHSFAAIPGYGQYPEHEDFIAETFKEILKSDRFSLGNDCLNAWAGSLNAEPGINLILGTGSIGFGFDNDGDSLRCGGWGHILGDEASGYYIGLKILNYFTKISDGRLDSSPLYKVLKEKLKIEDDFEVIPMVESMTRDEIASIARFLGELLDLNDEYAFKILDESAYEASLVINTISKRLNFDGKIKVSYSGGVFNLGEIFIDKLKTYVESDIEIVEPFADPTIGSLILAKKFYNN